MAERLGRYLLERKLASGGMAEVFLARQSGPEGFEKLCVVKRMLPTLAADPGFVRMFLDEARLAAQLNHPNIAQIFDFGESGGTYFLAMEHVPGSNLRAIVKDHARRGAYMPVAVAARIISQAALALDYAHNASSVDGKPLGLIHRDVSPQNILLGTAGTVKLIDFGVAKASIATHHTRTGLIKGKFAYMSPEQIRAQPLDCRSDLYSLGLVLYELLASARALQGATDVAMMEAAMRMSFDPIERKRPDLPEAMRRIVLRALERDREVRYQTALELSEDLERFLTSQGAVVTGADLGRLIGEIPQAPLARPEEPASGSNSSAKQPAVAIQPAFWEVDPQAVPTEVGSRLELEATLLRNREGQGEGQPEPPVPLGAARADPSGSGWGAIAGPELLGGSTAPTLADRARVVPRPPPGEAPPVPSEVKSIGSATAYQRLLQRQRRRTSAIAILMVGSGIGLAAWYSGRERPAEAEGEAVAATASPPLAPAPAEPEAPAAPAPLAAPPPPPAPARSKARPARSSAPPAAAASASLVLSTVPPMEVWVDGVARGKTPVTVPVPPGEHAVSFREDFLGLRRTSKVRVARGESRAESWRPSKGLLTIRAVPYAQVFLGERSLGLTPMAPLELWEGSYRFRFTNQETGRTETREVAVQPGMDTLVKVDLRPEE